MRIEGLKRRSFVVRYLTLFGGEGISKLCALGAFAYLARALGPHRFGIIELALSVMVFFLLATETGSGSYGARLIERTPDMMPQLIPRIIVLRALLAIPAYTVLLFISARYGMPGIGILGVYGVLVLLAPFFVQWAFQGLRQMQWVAISSVIRYGVFAGVVFVFVRHGSDTRLVAMAEVSGAIALVIFNAIIIRRVLHLRLDWHGAFSGALHLFREVWYLGASDLSWAAMWYAPAVILGWTAITHTEQIAWLGAAVRVVMALHTFVWLYFFNMLPNLSREIHQGLAGWRELLRRSMAGSTWLACLVAIGGTLFAPIIVGAVYGDAYAPAVLPLQIVIWMIPVAWFSGHFRYSLIAGGHQHLEFMAAGTAGLVTIVATWLGMREYGAPGAAAALLLGGLVNALLSGFATSRAIGPVRLTTAAVPAFSCLAATLVGLTIGETVDSLFGAVSGLALYGVAGASHWNRTQFELLWQGRRH